MNIIKRGIPPAEKVYNVICSNCKSQLEFQQKEGSISRARDQRDEDSIGIACPVCTHNIITRL